MQHTHLRPCSRQKKEWVTSPHVFREAETSFALRPTDVCGALNDSKIMLREK